MDKNDQLILEQRAQKLAEKKYRHDDRPVDSTAVVVSVGAERFGLPIERLVRIVRTPSISRLPRTAPWITGIVQLRGQLLCVIDLARWFRITTEGKRSFLVVLEGAPGLLGLLAEAVIGIRTVYQDQISQNLLDGARRSGRPLRATTDDLVTLLDIDRLFQSPQVQVGDLQLRPAAGKTGYSKNRGLGLIQE